MIEFNKSLKFYTTTIPGLTLWDLPVYGDNRGWFKENWQREKMMAFGLPDFRPVQNNVSFNDSVGTTRGIHAEPWDKFVSVSAGRVFGAWVDLRDGPNFGAVFTAHLDPSRAVFVPRGVGNAFQTLEPNTTYIYLVNDHYSPDAQYASLNIADETVAIEWPILLDRATISDKDRGHPRLRDVTHINQRKTLVLGAGGQLGQALRQTYHDSTNVEFAERNDIDITSETFESACRWQDYETIINAAAYTKVDDAETTKGRTAAWATNVSGVAKLARIATSHSLTLVHISSDYVFDGTQKRPYLENDLVSPLGVYGQTKAAGDSIVGMVPRHYILRTSWVVGTGNNFVRTMISLARRGIHPSVVNDQWGRLTFTSELARGIRHLIDGRAAFGTYNLSNSGDFHSWADIAREVFALLAYNPVQVNTVSTKQYYSTLPGPNAPRPSNSALDLSKIASTGFSPSSTEELLPAYVDEQLTKLTSRS